MKITVKLFAVARQLAECDEVEVELPERATVAQLRSALAEQHPRLAQLARQVPFAVDSQYAANETPIAADQEIACIPPVSGG